MPNLTSKLLNLITYLFRIQLFIRVAENLQKECFCYFIIHKQTDHDQTGLNLDELILDELALVWINSYTTTPVHVIKVANNKLTQLGTNLFRTRWIQNKSTCLWRQTRHGRPTLILICTRSKLIFICSLLRTLNIEIIKREMYKGITICFSEA